MLPRSDPIFFFHLTETLNPLINTQGAIAFFDISECHYFHSWRWGRPVMF